MKSKAKWYLLLGLVVFLISSIAACSDTPRITAQQVIYRVQVYGVPQIEGAFPVGQWAASYEGEGVWRVQGTIARKAVPNGTTWSDRSRRALEQRGIIFEREPTVGLRYYSTTWIHTNDEIRLLLMED